MQSIKFDERNLTPFAQPVSVSNLKKAEIYFFVNFADDALLFPSMEPFVFIGKDLEPNDTGIVYFQDLDSYLQGVRFDPNTNAENAMFYCGAESETAHIFEYERALEELMRCSLRRKLKKRKTNHPS